MTRRAEIPERSAPVPNTVGHVKRVVLLSLLAVLLSWCGAPPGVTDASVPDSGADDAGASADGGAPPDAGLPGDAGSGDDAGLPGDDAGVDDAGVEPDAGTPDAGSGDAGAVDAGPVDAGGPDAGPPRDAQGCPLPSDAGAPFTFRAMAANLTSGNLQSYDPGHGARIMQGSQPDVVMIQEFNYGGNSQQALDEFVANTFDGSFAWFRGNGLIANGVISRFPILARGEWNDTQVNNREFTWALVDLPGAADLWVISVHLLTANASTRNTEARELLAYVNANIPRGDYVLLGGDFNTDTRGEAAYSTLAPVFVSSDPQPADHDGVEGTNASRSKPYDGVYASRCLAKLQVPTVIGSSSFDAGAVIDTRVYTPISEIAPALVSDSAAPQMQHMGVLKDFLIQP